MAEYIDGNLTLTIETIDDEDYDGNPVQIKTVEAVISGNTIPVNYSYPGTDTDTAIQAAVKTDLTDRGYTW